MMNFKKPNPSPNLAITEQKMQETINDKISYYAAEIFKNYLPNISNKYSVKALKDAPKPEETVAYFEITKFVISEKDNMIDKLKNVYHLLAYSSRSIALVIRRKHDSCQIGIAVGKGNNSEASIKLAESVQNAIMGNFPGTSCGKISVYNDSSNDNSCLFQTLNSGNQNSVAIVTNIASEFSEGYNNQGIEKLIDGIIPDQDKEYTIIILGEALNNNELERKKNELYQTYTILSPFSKRTETWNIMNSDSWGINANAGFAFIASAGVGGNYGQTNGQSSGSSLEVNHYGITHTMEIIEKQMERLERCEALGIWNFAAYVFSSDYQLTDEVAHMYMSLTQGNESYYEKPSINLWNREKNSDVETEINNLTKYIRILTHPVFVKSC